jgi:hypothetical protein
MGLNIYFPSLTIKRKERVTSLIKLILRCIPAQRTKRINKKTEETPRKGRHHTSKKEAGNN